MSAFNALYISDLVSSPEKPKGITVRRIVIAIVIFLCLAGWIMRGALTSPSEIITNALVRQQIEAALKQPPIQMQTTRPSFAYKGVLITPRAEYDITGVVFSTRRYHWNFVDDTYKFLPEDLALGWGPLGDFKYKDILHIRQEHRFFKYRYRGEPPFPPNVLIANMSNNHIMPANDDMADKLRDIRPGDIVHMKGALIDVVEPGKGTISTSLIRTDTGAGACEILWLEALEVER